MKTKKNKNEDYSYPNPDEKYPNREGRGVSFEC